MTCLHFNINPDGESCADCGYCMHSVHYAGLCALCGAIIDEDNSKEDTSNNDHIDMTHDASGITVSKTEAERIQKRDEERLLKAKKLSLIVDLDQTILHAAWESRIAEWVDSHKQTGDSRAKDMSTFTLDGSRYTIKLRPGTLNFLKEMSKLYEMHVYTMGTRAYAKAVTAVIDPTMELFHDRILTRDENGSSTKKRLERLFPADQSKVVVLDDRGDVWDYSPNLIQIKPYEYFAGVGDINAPPNAQSTNLIPTETIRDDVNTTDVNNIEQPEDSSAVNNNESEQESTVNSNQQEPDNAVNNKTVQNQNDSDPSSGSSSDDSDSSSGSSSDDSDDDDELANDKDTAEKPHTNTNGSAKQDEQPDSTESQNSAKDDKTAQDQSNITESHTNENLEDESYATGSQSSTSVEDSDNAASIKSEAALSPKIEITSPATEVSPQEQAAINIVQRFNPPHEDSDRILDVINKALTEIHDEYYRRVDKGDSKVNVATILPEIKQNILKDCTIVFSGVIPLQQRAKDASIWRMATSFGANCIEELTGKVTHLVAANAGTSKVNTARKHQNIKIVSPPWLMNSIWNFKRENEDKYLIPVEDVSSEVENPEETSLEFEEEELDLDMDWSDSEIDEVLADDTGTDGTSTPAPTNAPVTVSASSLASSFGPESASEDDQELDTDWLGAALEEMDSEGEADIESVNPSEDMDSEGEGDVASVASSHSFSSSTSSNKRHRDFDDDEPDEADLPSSKRLK